MAAKSIKPGHVVRLDPLMWSLVAAAKRKGESVSVVIRRLLNPPVRRLYVLPSDLINTIEEARGRAVVRSVKKRTKPERPVMVKVDE